VGPAFIGLVSGEVNVVFSAASSATPYIKSGKIRAIGVTSLRRLSALPDVAPVAETLPGFESSQWFGILAPAGTPRPIVDLLNAAMRKALADPEAIKQLANAGLEPAVSSPEEFGAYIKSEIDKWTKVARAANVKLD
jgi:tripartite-type tricarboxylate transporter receptor subunit TctC